MTVCQFCGTKLMDKARWCYNCERELHYPTTDKSTVSKPTQPDNSCPRCKTNVGKGNAMLACTKCGDFFCERCEKVYRKTRQNWEDPYCSECFLRYKNLIRKLSINTYTPM